LTAAPPLARISVGALVERRKAASAWIDYVWTPSAVLPGVPVAQAWTEVGRDSGVITFFAGAIDIELHRSETGNYRDNLASGQPKLWVVLRPTGGEPAYDLIAVTADPAEGEAFTETGSDLVDAVPMPDSVAQQVAAFVAEHHVERPFFKRKRDRADPEALGHKPRNREDGPHE
jgi:hypothetical protein